MAKRTKPPRAERNEDLSSAEDERVLNRLLALLSGRGSELDWESVVTEGRRADQPTGRARSSIHAAARAR
jgi:hypothetical protein